MNKIYSLIDKASGNTVEFELLNEVTYDKIWDKIYQEFKFNPSIHMNVKPFDLPMKHKIYKLNSYWTDEQEILVNEIFKRITIEKIYALDWHHDCFLYKAQNDIPVDFNFYDEERDCYVYFPTYYPDGDYYFFYRTRFFFWYDGASLEKRNICIWE